MRRGRGSHLVIWAKAPAGRGTRALASNREIAQGMVRTVEVMASDLQRRALWDAGLWGLQTLILLIVYERLDGVRRGKRALGA